MRELNVIFFFFLIFLFACSGSDKKKSNKENLGVEITASDMEKGGQLYRAKCMNCHLKTGKGIPKVFPPLANSDYLRKNTDEAIKMVKFGSNKPIKVNGIKYNSLMPASGLTDKELVLVFNYILNSWENNYGQVSLEEVAAIKR
ncbi:cytochrome c [Labilibaculum sp. DW002]|uniref:Cytochrome c n=1 Tax=Paralabilibaculum antarcticum TaxID=2912572 RepID=A0ABT5VTV5_9BACT|nr:MULTISPECIES: cytochrome c [unclassified Labilibaculum]MBI9056339.1 cytochrome c [Labilibaculum sp.]MDE5418227.1 cytochrome c [Labilibaculum sp. DW002]